LERDILEQSFSALKRTEQLKTGVFFSNYLTMFWVRKTLLVTARLKTFFIARRVFGGLKSSGLVLTFKTQSKHANRQTDQMKTQTTSTSANIGNKDM